MWPLTFGCSPVDWRAGWCAPQRSCPVMKEQRHAGHMTTGTSLRQGGLSINCWTVDLPWVSVTFETFHHKFPTEKIKGARRSPEMLYIFNIAKGLWLCYSWWIKRLLWGGFTVRLCISRCVSLCVIVRALCSWPHALSVGVGLISYWHAPKQVKPSNNL